MKTKGYETHLFICQSCRYKKQDSSLCHPDTATELKKRVKQLCAERVPKEVLRINSSGCLGRCESGINAVIYPQNIWHTELKEGDEGKLAQSVLESYAKLINSDNRLK